MRQLVSVVTDDAVRYFVQDGDDVRQIAQLLNTGLAVPDVIELGATLTSALRLNGTKSTKTSSSLPTAHVVAAPSAPPALPKPRQQRRPMPAPAERRRNVLDDLEAHPDSSAVEISRRLYGRNDPQTASSTGYDLKILAERRLVDRQQVESGASGTEYRWRRRHTAAVDDVEQLSE